jgi:phosphoglycerate dehydrogenase-like enzyme
MVATPCRSRYGGATVEVHRELEELMTVKVGINGFGRIGRDYLRCVLSRGTDAVQSSP